MVAYVQFPQPTPKPWKYILSYALADRLNSYRLGHYQAGAPSYVLILDFVELENALANFFAFYIFPFLYWVAPCSLKLVKISPIKFLSAVRMLLVACAPQADSECVVSRFEKSLYEELYPIKLWIYSLFS